MREVGLLKGYSFGPDPISGGCHVCRLTLIIKTGPLGLPKLAQACGDLVGEQIQIDLTAIQTQINGVTGEIK